MRRPTLGVVIVTTALLALVGLAGWGALAAWRLAGSAPMSVHGWIAMGMAGLFTALLTGGLLWLAFYSAREGYDDDQGY